jgi:uncharacterized protein with HEPN domain
VTDRGLRARDWLLHMIEAADRILAYTNGVLKEQFLADTMMQDAVVRNIEIIGEAANNLVESSPEIVQRYPSIPFAQIYGMRNRVAHGYFAVSMDMIWETVQTDIPELKNSLAALIAEWPELS